MVNLLLFVASGADASEGGVTAAQVVPALDPGERGGAELDDRRPGATLDHLEFVCPKPALRDRVIPLYYRQTQPVEEAVTLTNEQS
jgi:hypothetical protein